MPSEHLCLKWNNFEYNIASYLDILRNENDFVDVTITCGEKNFKAHKVILSACSPYFKGIFQENPCSHPVIILKNVTSNEMDAIMQYIYTGETYIAKDDLPSFLNTANLLQIIGLANYNVSPPIQNGTVVPKAGDLNQNHAKSKVVNNNSKPGLIVRKFPTKPEESIQKKTSSEPASPKKRTSSRNSDSDQVVESPPPKTEDTCPILSKQLLLPKKRKLSVVDQNKNVELLYDNSELSNSSEEVKDNTNILRGCLGEKSESEEPPIFPNVFGIKKEVDVDEDEDNVLEPEVGLSVKEENDFESTSEESLHNGDILLHRLQASYQDCKSEGPSDSPEDTTLLKVPKPDVSIFSKKLSKNDEGENLTLTPNVEIFLRNTNNNSDNLIHKLAKINLFKAKQCRKLKKSLLPKPEVIPGTSKCDKDSVTVKNGLGSDNKTFHLTNLPCPHCRQVYNNLSALKYHVRLMHSDLENKLFCYLCPMNFIEREYFKIHLWEAHNARF